MSMKKRNPIEREENDFYRTPYYCTDALCRVEKFDGFWVWEPACGDGEMSSVLAHHGYTVLSTDLVDRQYGTAGFDFLNPSEELAHVPINFGMSGLGAIVTNPPYSAAEAFIHKALTLGAPKVCMFLRMAFLEGEKRRKSLYSVSPPSRVWVLSARPTLWHGGDGLARDTGGAIPYAWFVWDRASPAGAAPTIGWLPRYPSLELALASQRRARERLQSVIQGLSCG